MAHTLTRLNEFESANALRCSMRSAFQRLQFDAVTDVSRDVARGAMTIAAFAFVDSFIVRWHSAHNAIKGNASTTLADAVSE